MRILALDLSLTETGYAIHIQPDVEYSLFHGTIRPPKGLREGNRLLWIWHHIEAWAATAPDVWLIEDIPMHAKAAGVTAQLHGTVKAFAAAAGWPQPILVTPSSLKTFATGKGNADKLLMVLEAHKRLGYEGSNDNEADALWLRQLGLHIAKHPAAITLPQTHLRALDKIVVPL